MKKCIDEALRLLMRKIEEPGSHIVPIFILGCLLFTGMIYTIITLCGGMSEERWMRLP